MLSAAFVCSASTVVAQEFLESRDLDNNQCPWTTPTGWKYWLKCDDGSHCHWGRQGWNCCRNSNNSNRLQCPSSHPTMCAEKTCGDGDHCCADGDCSSRGGPRSCPCIEGEVRADPEDNCCEDHCSGGVFQKQCHHCACPSDTVRVEDGTCCGQCVPPAAACSEKSNCRQCLEEDGCVFTIGECMESCLVADVACWQGAAEETCAAFDQSQADTATCRVDALQTDCFSCSATAISGGRSCTWVGHGCVADMGFHESPQECCEPEVMRDDPDDACCDQQCNDGGVFKTSLCSFCLCAAGTVDEDDGICCNCVPDGSQCIEDEVIADSEDNCCELQCSGGVFQKQCHGCACPSDTVRVEDGTCCGQCVPAAEVCSLPTVTGVCRGAITKYGFDGTKGECGEFTWGGCGGNANNFDTMQECQDACGGN